MLEREDSMEKKLIEVKSKIKSLRVEKNKNLLFTIDSKIFILSNPDYKVCKYIFDNKIENIIAACSDYSIRKKLENFLEKIIQAFEKKTVIDYHSTDYIKQKDFLDRNKVFNAPNGMNLRNEIFSSSCLFLLILSA